MRRALAEYDVRGIRTTVPFFRWLLDQPLFREAAFHTEFLDTLLQQRHGASFSEPESSLREVALIAAAIYASRPASAEAAAGSVVPIIAGAATGPGAWTQQARIENLRA